MHYYANDKIKSKKSQCGHNYKIVVYDIVVESATCQLIHAGHIRGIGLTDISGSPQVNHMHGALLFAFYKLKKISLWCLPICFLLLRMT